MNMNTISLSVFVISYFNSSVVTVYLRYKPDQAKNNNNNCSLIVIKVTS